MRTTSPILLPPPIVFGLPPKFDRWRDMQCRAITTAIDSQKRFVLQAAPTGFGKSLVYVAQGKITDARTCILTSTKGLQSQLLEDFAPSGLVDIRGMNSYPCRAAEDFGIAQDARKPVTCEDGPCRAGLPCSLKASGCAYYDAYHDAQSADLVVTNYTYWMTINRYGEGLGNFDLLIMDEGHNAPDELSDFLAIEFDSYEIESVISSRPLAPYSKIDEWKKWAGYHGQRLEARLDDLKAKIGDGGGGGGTGTGGTGGRISSSLLRESSAGRRVLGKLKSLSGMRGDWIYEQTGGGTGGRTRHRFDPVWPKEYAESALFRGIEKVVVFSATLRPKTAEVLGIPRDQYDFNEYPSPFPIARRPVYHVPTCQMNHRATDAHLQTMLTRIDQILRTRQDRKGIIHTVSFARRTLVLQNSEFSGIMLANDSHNTRSVIERYKQADPPVVLVSPSVTTGFDFPYDACHYQILMKIPFPDNRPLIMQARTASDKDYGNYVAAQTLVQMCGRGMRAEDDLCECLILDDSIRWFMYRYKHFFPQWFLASFIWARSIPKPLDLGLVV